MATIAASPLRRVDVARSDTLLPLIVGLAGTLLSWFGSGWDVSWHRMFGRDTFWSTPHLFIYVGVALWGVAAIIATGTAMAGRRIRGRALVVGPFRAELGLGLIGIGALVTILAGPFDNLWHSLFGRDVDIWSPPHLAGIAGGAIGLLEPAVHFLAIDRSSALQWLPVLAQPSRTDLSPKPRAGSSSKPNSTLYRDNRSGLRSGSGLPGWFVPDPAHRLRARRRRPCSGGPG